MILLLLFIATIRFILKLKKLYCRKYLIIKELINMPKNSLPIVYSCSGCSSAAQMANFLAIQLDRSGIAEMSCIAGVGGDVKKMLKKAKSATEIIVIDGCVLSCAKACLNRHGLAPSVHYQLADFGIKKKEHEDFDQGEASYILSDIKEFLLQKF
jgi:uncharacterized metal-binding protein